MLGLLAGGSIGDVRGDDRVCEGGVNAIVGITARVRPVNFLYMFAMRRDSLLVTGMNRPSGALSEGCDAAKNE